MHKRGIVHRDLKPDNILVLDKDRLEVCIADLGLACRVTDTSILGQNCGTPGYVGPEILKGFPASTKSDIFSLGSIFYNIVTGNMLFEGKDHKEVLRNNKYKDPCDIIDDDMLLASSECVNLLKKMLAKSPEDRPSSEECLNVSSKFPLISIACLVFQR
jgi:serine/threonine protein kinase